MVVGDGDPLKVSSRVHETLIFVFSSFSWCNRFLMVFVREKGVKMVFEMEENAMKNECASRGTPRNSEP